MGAGECYTAKRAGSGLGTAIGVHTGGSKTVGSQDQQHLGVHTGGQNMITSNQALAERTKVSF